MKTEKELKVLKDEFEALNQKLAELTDEELQQVTGGALNNGVILVAIDNSEREQTVNVPDMNDGVGACPFVCPDCGAKFETGADLVRHSKQHYHSVIL